MMLSPIELLVFWWRVQKPQYDRTRWYVFEAALLSFHFLFPFSFSFSLFSIIYSETTVSGLRGTEFMDACQHATGETYSILYLGEHSQPRKHNIVGSWTLQVALLGQQHKDWIDTAFMLSSPYYGHHLEQHYLSTMLLSSSAKLYKYFDVSIRMNPDIMG